MLRRGGVLGAVWEVAECSGLGVDVFVEKIPVKEETKKICKAMGIDYLGLISSGSDDYCGRKRRELSRELTGGRHCGGGYRKIDGERQIYVVNDMRLPLAQPRVIALYEAKL